MVMIRKITIPSVLHLTGRLILPVVLVISILPPILQAAPSDTPGNSRYQFEFRNESLSQALYVISERSGADMIFDPAITEGVEVSGTFEGELLRLLLDDLLRPAGLEARRIRTGVFVIRYRMRRDLDPIVTFGQTLISGKIPLTVFLTRTFDSVDGENPPGGKHLLRIPETRPGMTVSDRISDIVLP